MSPFDVRLNADTADDVVFQPDILVICDRSKLDPKGRGYRDAPTLVVEVLSPYSGYLDRGAKFERYEQYGVPEYWIIDPPHKLLEVNVLEDGAYVRKGMYNHTQAFTSHTLEGCNIDLSTVFPEEE